MPPQLHNSYCSQRSPCIAASDGKHLLSLTPFPNRLGVLRWYTPWLPMALKSSSPSCCSSPQGLFAVADDIIHSTAWMAFEEKHLASPSGFLPVNVEKQIALVFCI